MTDEVKLRRQIEDLANTVRAGRADALKWYSSLSLELHIEQAGPLPHVLLLQYVTSEQLR